MRTQATQTDVKKTQTASNVSTAAATALLQKQAASPGAKLKVFFYFSLSHQEIFIWPDLDGV